MLMVFESMDEAAAGPGIGPSIAPPPMSIPSISAPLNPLGGTTKTSTAQSMAPPMSIPNGPTPVALPTLHYQGMNAHSTFGYQPPPPPPSGVPPMGPPGMGVGMGMGPPRMPGMHGGPPPGMYGAPGAPGQLAGTIRNVDEMHDGEEPSNEQLAKRQRVAKLPGGHLYPEQNWIDMHPVRLSFLCRLVIYDFPAPDWSSNPTTQGRH